ncbi:MAG: ABC-ATPase domain-containing protein, partial [Gammaproteobacteria bacterium]|nr:ABC-ATPase domain-containing protein [Gammaproteobacteria bacterium]
DGQDYAAYQSLLGNYHFDLFNLDIKQIPKDPYAPPHTGIYCIKLKRDHEKIVKQTIENKIQKIAFADYLARRFFNASNNISKGIRGTGFSGVITINEPGQAILERNSIIITEQEIEVRCFVGLPGNGRRINAKLAEAMLFEELPEIINAALLEENIDREELQNHVNVAEDAEYLRKKLNDLELVAFIANGSILPRESGTSDKPLSTEKAMRFISPDSLKQQIDLPHAGTIQGMAIPKGVTLIAGGGYHGKSTLLSTLEAGIYNHIPGDGREFCVSTSETAKVRAYSGRSVVKSDISPFINNLPFEQDTTAFCTENASGSTSQAANIVEAIEAGVQVLLMDEDTCATNFMIRDNKMQQLVKKEDEPITTFIDKIRPLYVENNISTILVLGGVGDYFDVSDHVIQMINYEPHDVTAKAHEIAATAAIKRKVEGDHTKYTVHERIPVSSSIDPCNEHGKFAIYAKETNRLYFGRNIIDLTDLEQLMELSQTKALGFAIEYAKRYMVNNTSLNKVVERVVKDIEEQGLDIISDRISGHFAWFRSIELAFAINRLRGLDVLQKEKTGFENLAPAKLT